ncbi:MAG TPA: hypothetical protein VEO95_10030, partial [Chthoniobacteraceae bacterium]|nr:hypothetical protein [Chthoniobacteraceae bacterium]
GRDFYDLAFAKRPAEELYDLKKDRDEIDNVAGDPAYSKDRKRLAAQLDQLMRDYHDPRLDDTFDKPPFTDAGPPPPRRKAAQPR